MPQNDVFLYASFTLWDGINPFSSTNGRFWQLPAAPLSPRAFMAATSLPLLERCGRYNLLNGSTCVPNEDTVYSFVIVGGQSGHACGDPLLGRCETDVWTLTMTPNTDSPEHGWRADWRIRTAAAPIPARCGSSVLQQSEQKTYEMDRIIGIVGGQLSFEGDDSAASCNASLPIGSSNEAYYSTADNLAVWRRGVDAPFSPRRSMQVDDSFLLGNSGVLLRPDRALLVDFDKSVSLTGGIAYLERQWSPSTGISRMTRAEVFADVWSCTLVTPEYDSSPIDCDWHHSQPIADTRQGRALRSHRQPARPHRARRQSPSAPLLSLAVERSLRRREQHAGTGQLGSAAATRAVPLRPDAALGPARQPQLHHAARGGRRRH